MRVRCAMIDEVPMLEGIIEADEAYIGGKPRKRNQKGVAPDNEANLSRVLTVNEKPKRGRGTKKVPIVGFVERGGQKRVVTQIADRLTTKSMLALLHKYVNDENAIMMTDEARFYNGFDTVVQHLVIKHKEKYVDGVIHTNTIEGYWSIIKNGIRGEFHSLSRKYLPFYLAEFSYKYNRRNNQEAAFNETIENAVTDDSCLTKYKPIGETENNEASNKKGKKPLKKKGHLLAAGIVSKKSKTRSIRKGIIKTETAIKQTKQLIKETKTEQKHKSLSKAKKAA